MRASERFLIVSIWLMIFAAGIEAADMGAVDEVRQTVRARLLERINQDRAGHGLRPVELDETASFLADRYCERQIDEGTRGHFTTDGLPPYMRYSFARLEGHVIENAAAWSSRAVFHPSLVPDLALRSHAEMLAEVPPHDGHRRAILDPWATHVGIGVAWEEGEVRFAELFVRRYLEWIRPQQSVESGQTVTFEARWTGPAHAIEAVTVHYEPFPYRLSRERANLIDSYALPPEAVRFEPPRVPSRLEAALRPASRETPAFRLGQDVVAVDVPFERRGVYTLVVWMRPAGTDRPVAATSLSIASDAR